MSYFIFTVFTIINVGFILIEAFFLLVASFIATRDNGFNVREDYGIVLFSIQLVLSIYSVIKGWLIYRASQDDSEPNKYLFFPIFSFLIVMILGSVLGFFLAEV